MKKNLLIGAHVSISGGFDMAIENGEAIGATCVQIFTKSNRQWKASPIDDSAVQKYKTRLEKSSIRMVVAHASYLINLGSKNPETLYKSKESLTVELQRCDQLSIPFLILHPGTQHSDNEQESLELVAQCINESINATNKTTLLLETMAGQGTTVGSSFEQLAAIIKRVENKNRIGVCLDTCHVFAAGYTFQTREEYTKMWGDLDATIGKEYIKVIHMNDSKKELGSRVDRHEHIGQGKIGIEAFGFFMKDTTIESVPKILETPAENGEEDDIRNINILKELSKV